MDVEVAHTQPKVLMIGEHQLVLDNVRVLLSTMGCQGVICSTLKQALALLEKVKPEAAIVDEQVLVHSPVEILLALHKVVLRLQGRAVVLTREEKNLQLSFLTVLSSLCMQEFVLRRPRIIGCFTNPVM